ncbi:hypothetical protein PF005_g29557 [Phytophthora fragariae]|uniref:RxLR effector protein n=1 Tax=Phytophthora fragariae TaxID=53985 RepID=A0A6A4B232_9STRA|nr:hypothetical protein PF009_g30485 [Phytophthora fragariae]KAE8962280.1 hypothetical protein PF011_g29452 [Phytophthora fragariae]KAE9061869.1 hypothetical protein PF007_g30104 [Phytophthora fragariae]KAE9067679.1 hypothetical protein PF006_g29946 [Phytophthora fragariae]KAE9101038.1 hypothetical protein PF010_g14592 [Phytophthora fragariae]
MRPYYILLVAAAAFLASSEAFSLTIDSDKTQVSELASSDAARSITQGGRFLRATKTEEDEESDEDDSEERTRTWAHIAGFDRNEAEAMEFLLHWLGKDKSVEYVAKKLGTFKLPQNEALGHFNWEALTKYQKMHFQKRTGREQP